MKSFIPRSRTLAVLGVLSSMAAAAALDAPGDAAAAARRHLRLVRAEPAIDTTVKASPATVKLFFSEPVKAPVTAVRVLGPNDTTKVVTMGAVTIDTAKNAPVVAPVRQTLAPGKYQVVWRTLAADGHPTTGKFAFTVAAAEERDP